MWKASFHELAAHTQQTMEESRKPRESWCHPLCFLIPWMGTSILTFLPPQLRDTPITIAFLFFPIMADYTLKPRAKISLLT